MAFGLDSLAKPHLLYAPKRERTPPYRHSIEERGLSRYYTVLCVYESWEIFTIN